MGVVDELQRARDAFERGEWVSAFRALSDLAPEAGQDLHVDDLMALATTAFLLGRRNDCVQALQRAHQVALEGDDVLAAVRAASTLALVLAQGGEAAVAGGWVARAERLLESVDGDVVERGHVLVLRMFRHIGEGDMARALDVARRVTGYGQRHGDGDLLALGLNAEGRLLTHTGEVLEGLRIMDEAMVGVVAGEVSPVVAGIVYCSMIEACTWLGDFGRVAEWTHALTAWCAEQPGLVAFTGQCAVHRGQLMRLNGAFEPALEELELAVQRYAAQGGNPAVALALQERGDVLRILGEYKLADEAYDAAGVSGDVATPGRALLWLAEGRLDAAVGAARRQLDEAHDPVSRSRVLPAAADVLVAAEAVDEAAPLVEELGRLAIAFDSPALRGAAGCAAAQVALARGDVASAAEGARRAVAAWTTLSAEYEVARCRTLLGRAYRMQGDEPAADAELRAARAVFARLGALPAERECARLLGAARAPGGLSPREVEVLRLVAAGRSNAQVADALFLSEKTVARHLSNIFTKLGVSSRTAASAFAYEHGLL
ncbi:response regulator transcription factor [Promicromonospora panici]|uniref:response regulator transcription factor n=1 Tax=Promicromonospora panici TaxID=2219658 RepID=UPI00101C3F8A|nr:response regulator transcription factor [Promicromonospora panici]